MVHLNVKVSKIINPKKQKSFSPWCDPIIIKPNNNSKKSSEEEIKSIVSGSNTFKL